MSDKQKNGNAGNSVEHTLETAVARETAVHGSRWAAQYGGYFSDPAVAEPLLRVIEESVNLTGPDVLVDLGGGTGFILRELIRREKIAPGLTLYDLDLSDRQLQSLSDTRIRPLKSSFMEFKRGMVAAAGEQLMLVTRSTLHYAGILGQDPVLKHIRGELKPGELFIHQTGCATTPEEALLTDEMMELIHSDKWMPPLDSLVKLCENAGFRVSRIDDAPDLLLDESTLADRYAIPHDEMIGIRGKLQKAYRDFPRFKMTPHGFVIVQAYKIMVCEAV